MFSKKTTGGLFGTCLALTYTALIAVAVAGAWPKIRTGLSLLLLTVLAVGIYFAGKWALVDRQDELNKKYPVSSKELRRRKKEFYESLGPQNRH